MKKITFTFLLFALLIGESSLFAQSKYSKIKIYGTDIQLNKLRESGVTIDHGERKKDNYFISDFSPWELNKIKNSGLNYEIVIDDVSKYYVTRSKNAAAEIKAPAAASCGVVATAAETFTTPANFSLGSMGGFFTYAEFLAHLDTMAAKYPNLITIKAPIDTFHSIEGRPIYWLRISDNPQVDENEPEVLYTALHHAREPASTSQIIMYMYYLLENYGTDTEVTYLVDNTEMYFIPMVNPDGYIYNETTNPNGGGMWRKNRRNNGDGTFGVDLNRNYGYHFGLDNQGSSPSTNSDTYRGTAAFSEPETQAVKYFVENRHIQMTLNYHTYGNLLIYPWGYALSLFTPDSATFTDFAKVMTVQNNYNTGTGDQTVGYVTNGDSDDWSYGEQTSKPEILSFTPEAGTSNDGFWPPSNRIETISKENIRQNLNMAQLVLKYGTVTDKSSTVVNSKTGYLAFEVQSLGLDTPNNYTISFSALGNELQSVGNPIVMNNLGHLKRKTDSIAYQLTASLQAGQTFSYVLKLDNGFVTTTDTITKTYGTGTPVFTDAANDLSSWNTISWGLTSAQFHSPSSSITDSPNGDYSNNSNTDITINNAFDLTNSLSASLSYWAKWALEPGFDYVEIMASIDGGTTWQPLCGKYTKTGNTNQDLNNPLYDGVQSTWVQEEIDLTDVLGNTVLLKFHLKSDSFVTDDGFYFDDLMISSINPPALTTVNTITNAACGSNDGAISVVVSGGTTPYTYAWSNNSSQTAATVTALAAGNYNVTITDAANATQIEYYNVANINGPTVAATTTNVSCFGGSNGAVNLVATGGTSPYTYNWSNGSGGIVLTAGQYTVTTTDANNCVNVVTYTITENTALAGVATIIGSSANNGSISITVTGGAAPYNYNWSNNATTDVVNNLNTGTYLVTITDNNGCKLTQQYAVNNLTTSVESLINENSFMVYPNPSAGQFTVQLNTILKGIINLKVRNLIGQLIYQKQFKATQKTIIFNLQNSSRGIYSLSLNTENGERIIKKIIVE